MRDYIYASHRNKNFVTAIINSLDQLNAAEFIRLFLQVDDPTAYKIAKNDFFPQAKLLSEIADNSSSSSLTRDHGEIIIQALYAAPKLENVARVMAMMLVGGTLDYAEFQRVFGEKGDLKPDVLSGDERNAFQDTLNHVFGRCAAQSTDVQILIDKLKCLEFVLDANEHNGRIGAFILDHYKFDPESFFRFYHSLNEAQKQKPWLLSQAPYELYESEIFAKMVAGGYIPHTEYLNAATLKAFKNDDAETFNTLLPHLMSMKNARKAFSQYFMSDFERAGNIENLSEKQVQMKDSFNQKVAELRSKVISNSNNIQNGDSEQFVLDLLKQAFQTDNADAFSVILHEANANKSQSRFFTLNAVFEYLYAGSASKLNDTGITQNNKAMILAMSECITGRIEDIKAMVESSPTITEQERKKDRPVSEVCGPGFN